MQSSIDLQESARASCVFHRLNRDNHNRHRRSPQKLLISLALLSASTMLSGLLGCSGHVNPVAAGTSPNAENPSDPSAAIPDFGAPSARRRPHSPVHIPNPNPTNPDPTNPDPSNPEPTITLPAEQATAAAAFTGSVGVVTHLSYTNTPYYTQFPQILADLKSLGVRHIRDGYYPWAESNPIVQAHQQVGAAGIKCDFVVPYDLTTTPQAIEQFAPMVTDMESLEPPNECDVSGGCDGTGASAIDNLVAFLPVVKTAADTLNVPMLGPSFVNQESYSEAGNLSSEMTVNNLHIYFGGRNPGSAGWGADDAEGNSYGSFAWWLDQAQIDGPGMPSEITETGYISSSTTSTPYTLPDSVEASYAPRTLLLAYKNGFKETFLYELIDEVSSPGYGLMNSDLSPKPAFTAVENLLSTLSDSGLSDGGSSFTPGSLPYQLSGGDSNLNHLLLQKSDGSYWLVLWLEVPSWNPASAAPVAVTPESITLELNGAYSAATAYQFDNAGNVTSSALTMNGYNTSLSISDQLTIVHITPQ
jgi:hypothetical protein